MEMLDHRILLIPDSIKIAKASILLHRVYNAMLTKLAHINRNPLRNNSQKSLRDKAKNPRSPSKAHYYKDTFTTLDHRICLHLVIGAHQ